jgi:hypothetical protein
MNLLAIPSSLSRWYSTFPLCSGTTLIEIAVCMYAKTFFKDAIFVNDFHKGRQSILKITSKFKKLGKTASPDFMFVTAQVSKKKVLGVI